MSTHMSEGGYHMVIITANKNLSLKWNFEILKKKKS